MNIIKQTYLLIILLAVSAFAHAFNVSMNLDKRRVYIGEHLIIEVKIENGNGDETIDPPESSSFYLSSRGQSSQMSWINGKSSSSVTHTYLLVPEKPGDVLIGSFRVGSSRQELKTKPVNIQILPAEEQKKDLRQKSESARISKKQLWVEQELSDNEVYVDQPVELKFKIFIENELPLRDGSYEMADLKEFVTEKPEQQRRKVRIGNRYYDLIEISQVIYPTKAGKFTIGESMFTGSILERSKSRSRRSSPFDMFEDSFFSNSMFGSYSRRPVKMLAKAVDITVKPLPAQARPANFKGSVGNYSLGVTYSATENIKQGEAVTVTMTITGEGHIENVTEPELKGLTGFKSFDAEVELSKDADNMGGSKTFKKMIIPEKTGQMQLPSVAFSFYNYKAEKFITLEHQGPEVNIAAATKVNSGQGVISTNNTAVITRKAPDLKITGEDIIFLKTKSKSLKKNQEPLREFFFPLLCFITVIFSFIAVFTERYFKLNSQDSARQRRSKAYTVFRKSSKEARTLLKKDISLALAKMDEAFSLYFADKLNLPAGTWTAKDVQEKLSPLNYNQESLDKLVKTLTTMDMMRYGAVKSDEKDAENVFRELEAEIIFMEKQKL